jgi:hypothetical protein
VEAAGGLEAVAGGAGGSAGPFPGYLRRLRPIVIKVIYHVMSPMCPSSGASEKSPIQDGRLLRPPDHKYTEIVRPPCMTKELLEQSIEGFWSISKRP